MSSGAEWTIAVVGAGPRGTSFLERMLAHAEHASTTDWTQLHIKVFDPAPHGPGKVWNPDQSPLYLMNTPASFPTAAPTGATQGTLPPSSCSASFAQYARTHGPTYDDAEFPARADYGRYLTWLSTEVTAGLRDCGVRVEHLSAEVTSLTQAGSGYHVTAGDATHQVEAVVLALGHLNAVPAGPSGRLAAAADEAGLHYQGAAIPTEVTYDTFPAGTNVLVRGMGLNFFDLLIQVTAGRGGRFQQLPGTSAGYRYDYLASGEEPLIIAGARRGTPYRAKTTADGSVPRGIELRHLTDRRIGELLQQHRQLDFTAHLWPLIQADTFEAYLKAGGTDPQFDVVDYAHPFAHRKFPSHQDYQQQMLRWLADDAAAAEAGSRSPEKMAVHAVHAARLRLKPMLSAGQITDVSRLRDVEGWFESLVEGLASGPPLQRIEELAALARAGVVEFLGPDPIYGVDRQARRYIADSAAVSGARYTAGHMIEAMMPPNRVTQADSALLAGMLREGLARPAHLQVGEEAHRHKGLDVTDRPHQLLTACGQPLEAVYALGLQLSSVQWGTAIAAQAGGAGDSTAHTLTDADAAARDILCRYSTDVRGPHGGEASAAAITSDNQAGPQR